MKRLLILITLSFLIFMSCADFTGKRPSWEIPPDVCDHEGSTGYHYESLCQK